MITFLALKVMSYLNSLFTLFDELIDQYEVRVTFAMLVWIVLNILSSHIPY